MEVRPDANSAQLELEAWPAVTQRLIPLPNQCTIMEECHNCDEREALDERSIEDMTRANGQR